MKKFRLSDDNVAQQVYDHLKAFDKFDNLDISVQTINGLQIIASIKIDEENQFSFPLPQKDLLVGIPFRLERQVLYLSWQVKYFEDVEKLLNAPLLVKAYKENETDYALGETVVDGVKYEFSLAAGDLYDEPDFHIEIKFTKVDDYLQFDNSVKTHVWRSYEHLDETFNKLSSIVNQ